MLRISKLADYATLILSYMGKAPDSPMSAAQLAECSQLGLPTVRKLLKLLLSHGLLISERGASGGYKLACGPEKINMADIIAAIDGPIAITECAHPGKRCAHFDKCHVKENWQVINQIVQSALKAVSLQELTQKVERI